MLSIGARLVRLEETIAMNNKFVFTLLSYLMIPVILLNLTFLQLPFVGILASSVFLTINAALLGHTFFRNESSFLRFVLGLLMLIMLLGFIGWLTMITWNLDITQSVIVLFIVTTFSSIVRLIGKHPLRKPDPKVKSRKISQCSCIISVSYLLLVGISLSLLLLARSGEVYTVWEALNPLFLPFYFSATFLLLSVIFSPGNVDKKLLFIIIHCILTHSLYAVIFPAGDIGAQILTLGRSRLVYENISINGWPVSLPPTSNFFSRIYYWFRGINFQTALSVTFARMLAVDILWSHLWLVPLFWGTFVPLAAFLTSRALGIGERASLLAGLLISLCPNTIYYGAISVAYSLGLVFFFLSLYFALSYLSNGGRALLLLLIFSFFSFLSHFLTGVMSFSMLFLVVALRRYAAEKATSPKSVKALWCVTLLFCSSLVPIFLLYQKLFFPFYTYVSLRNLRGLSVPDMISRILVGGYLDFSPYGAILNATGALLGLFVMIYYLKSKIKTNSDRSSLLGSLFLFSGFLMALIDYRVLEIFMVGVPFNEERIWLFRDFFAIPFLGLLFSKAIAYLNEKIPKAPKKTRFSSSRALSVRVKPHLIITYILIFIALSGWIAASLFYSYPHFAPLQTTSYELQAVELIEKTTPEEYVVISDLWFTRAGDAIVGTKNPRALYLSHKPEGVSLFIKMKSNPTNETLIEAMKTNNATTAYFIIEKPRLGTEEYNRIKSQAMHNGVKTYPGGVFYYKEAEKLHIFYCKKSTD